MFKRVAKTIFRSSVGRLALVVPFLLPFSFNTAPASACSTEPMIGSMCVFAGNFAPRGYAFAQGQLLPISANSALFSILGTTYGGDGRTTFALPDMRGRALVGTGHGLGLSSYNIGEKGGAERVTLAESQMPVHSHGAAVTIIGTSLEGDATGPSGAILAQDERDNNYFAGEPTDLVDMSANAASISVGLSGGSQSIDTRSPYIAINWIIAIQGIYPSRN